MSFFLVILTPIFLLLVDLLRWKIVVGRELNSMGIWTEIKLRGRASKKWKFARYIETPRERAAYTWYMAFLFRNERYTQFGIREWFERTPHTPDLGKMAMRVISDDAFRRSLLSDREELPRWWKKR
jgi:hypothetical protein